MGKYDHSVTFFSFARQRVTNHYLENSEEMEAPGHRIRGLFLIETGVILPFQYLKQLYLAALEPLRCTWHLLPHARPFVAGCGLPSWGVRAQWCGEQAPGQARGLQQPSRSVSAPPLRAGPPCPDQEADPRPLPCKAGCQLLDHQGSPLVLVFQEKAKKKKRTCKNSDTTRRSKCSLFSMVTVQCLEWKGLDTERKQWQ